MIKTPFAEGELVEGYYKPVTQILKQHGFIQVPGGKGSHEKWKCGNRVVIVQRNMPSRHSANGVFKEAGINHKF